MRICRNCHEEYGTGYGDLCCICYTWFKCMGDQINK